MLPKLETPSYKIKLPSTGEDITLRPYTVGEEKVLLTALEGGSEAEMEHACIELIRACVSGADVDKMLSFDIVYLMIQLRSKSLGNELDLMYESRDCTPEEEGGDCPDHLTMKVNLDDVAVEDVETTKIIDLTSTISVEVSFLTYADYAKSLHMTSAESNEFQIKKSIRKVFDTENVYTDFSEDDITEFVSGMSITQKKEIVDFLKTTPTVKYEGKITCDVCGAEGDIKLEGLFDFFG